MFLLGETEARPLPLAHSQDSGYGSVGEHRPTLGFYSPAMGSKLTKTAVHLLFGRNHVRDVMLQAAR